MAANLPRVAFPLVLQSPVTGSAITGAKATITHHVAAAIPGSGTNASIFTTESGSGALGSNVITTDNTGRWTQGEGAAYAQYWLPEGSYDITISGTGITAVTITRDFVCGSTAVSSPFGAQKGYMSWGFITSTGGLGGNNNSEDFTPERLGVGEYAINWKFPKSGLIVPILCSMQASNQQAYIFERNSTVMRVNHQSKTGVKEDGPWTFIVMSAN